MVLRKGRARPLLTSNPLLFPAEEDSPIPIPVPGRLPVSLAGHPVVAAQAAAVQAAAAQAAVAAQAAALEQLREKLECGEPPEKKMALVVDGQQQRLMQRALQQNFLAMTAQLPMSIRISSQGKGRPGGARTGARGAGGQGQPDQAGAWTRARGDGAQIGDAGRRGVWGTGAHRALTPRRVASGLARCQLPA